MRVLWLLLALLFASSDIINASAYSPDGLVPMGSAIGINISLDGVAVVSVTDTKNGASPAKLAGICAGDIITEINGTEITCIDDIKNITAGCGGRMLNVVVLRGGKECHFQIEPCLNDSGEYEIGVWLRDSMSGLGTMTFYDPDTGVFGALGHGISDSESGTLAPLESGVLIDADVTEVVAGRPGFPGQLRGKLDFSTQLGVIATNTENGIFGTLNNVQADESEEIPLCSNGDIKVGKATVLCDIGDGTQQYEIEISRLYLGDGFSRKNMLVTVTDERLLETTGGIVQGMSGSPIIQDGKLAGAVTHVLINDPTKGYGITIGNMLSAMEESLKDAA